MKSKKLASILTVILALAMALTLTACGSKSLEGTYTNTPDWNTIMDLAEDEAEAFAGAGFWDMGLSIAGLENYSERNTIEFKSDGTYTYTMLAVLAESIASNFDRDSTAYVELAYTGTYSAGESDTWVLAFPTECVWSYNPGMFAQLGAETSTNNSYSAGATTISMFGEMGGGGDAMSAFGHQIIHFNETADTSATMTVTVDTSANTFTIERDEQNTQREEAEGGKGQEAQSTGRKSGTQK